jgi:sugar phosphate isomerase/epimerase
MQTRRNFIKTAGGALAVGLGGLYLPKWSTAQSAQNTPGPGVQLYTFHDIIERDVPGTLKKISELGVKNIESAFSTKGDYYGMKAADFASLLQSLGMKWRSHHFFGAPVKLPKGLPPLKNLAENLQQITDEASEGGLEFLVAAHLPIATHKEVYESLATLTKAAESTQKAGIQLLYHNETGDFNLNEVDGKIPYEVF